MFDPRSPAWCSRRPTTIDANAVALQGVANRDLKLENLLLDRDGSDGTRPLLKICDFGYSKVRLGWLWVLHAQAHDYCSWHNIPLSVHGV